MCCNINRIVFLLRERNVGIKCTWDSRYCLNFLSDARSMFIIMTHIMLIIIDNKLCVEEQNGARHCYLCVQIKGQI